MEIIPRLTSMTTLYLLSYLKALSDGVELTWLPTLIFYLRKEKYQGKFYLTEFELVIIDVSIGILKGIAYHMT